MDNYLNYFEDDFGALQGQELFRNKDGMMLRGEHPFLEDNSTEHFAPQPDIQLFFETASQSHDANSSEQKLSMKPSWLQGRSRVFNIVRDPQPANDCMKISDKTKAITREKKGKTIPFNLDSGSGTTTTDINEMIEEEMLQYQHLDEKSKKKMAQMVRNRISAQLSRDRRKVYMGAIEGENANLRAENLRLQTRVDELEQQCLVLQANNPTPAATEPEFICKFCGAENNVNHNLLLDEPAPKPVPHEQYVRLRHGPGPRGFFGLLTIFMASMILMAAVDVTREPIRTQIRLAEEQEEFTQFTTDTESELKCSDAFWDMKNDNLRDRLRTLQDAWDERRLLSKVMSERNTTAQSGNVTGGFNQIPRKNLRTNDTGEQNANLQPNNSQTVFCPSAVFLDHRGEEELLNDMKNASEGKLLARFQHKEWLQVFLPAQNLSKVGPSATIPQPFLPTAEGKGQVKEQRIVELICKLQNVRDVSA